MKMRERAAIAFSIALISWAPITEAKIHSVGLDTSLYTSDFMLGSVVVAVIFPESNGSVDPNTENWSEERKAKALSAIMSGLNWWPKQNPKAHLSFTFVTETVSTKYEPITRPYYGEALWIPDVISKLGFSGNRFTATREYVNSLRNTYNADWGFVIFVVDSQNDSNGKFSDGYFAYAYLGGPFLVMTYDNGGYGIANMDVVVAHETGHIFQALDQYAGASSPYDYSQGYFPTINGNHAWSVVANDPNSIMRGGIRWGLDSWARQMIGWRDLNKNGREDIIDQLPDIGILQGPQYSDAGDAGFSGLAQIQVLPRQNNSKGNGFTLNTITKVQYATPGEEWRDAVPVDGQFDSAEEPFSLEIPTPEMELQSVSAQSIQVRALTFYDQDISNLSGGGGGSSSLNSAHAFPNPYKPNSNLSHENITFTGLTPDAKVQVFSAAGEPVFEKETDSAGNSIVWDGHDDSGKKIASGVYFYLITNPSGNAKKGKLAVIR